MATNNSIINPGNPVQSSIPLVARRFGQGFGFSAPSTSKIEVDREVVIDLSTGTRQRSAISEELKSSASSSLSSSPLNQALDTLGEIAQEIAVMQERYSRAAGGSSISESLTSELNSLAKEFKRITDSDLFRNSGGVTESGSLQFTDSLLKSTLRSADQERIASLNDGLAGLSSVSFDNILTDKTISKTILEFINTVRGALSPQGQDTSSSGTTTNEKRSVLVPLPQASIKTVSQAEGLTVSLLSYSNEDLIRAAAAHVNIESTNVLILTFNAPEPETEEEKAKREADAQKIEIENPSFSVQS